MKRAMDMTSEPKVNAYRPASLFFPLCWLIGLLCLVTTPLTAQEIRVQVGVSTQDVYLGDSIVYQIQIKGSDQPVEPDLSVIKDFKVASNSGGPNNSQFLTIVNGRRTESIQRGYIFNYNLTPLKEGDLVIPSLPVVVEGKTYNVQPVSIRVRKPAETNDFKLRLSLSKTSCYVGEPVTLTVVWYLSPDKEVSNLNQFNLPVLNAGEFGSTFRIKETETTPPQNKKYVGIPVEDEEVYAVYGQDSLNGQVYTTLSFKRVLIPKKTGHITIPQATISFVARERGNQSVWDFFGSEATKYVVPSNQPALDVKALPLTGKPAGFSGLIGRYTLDVTAAPQEVRVGDPITLTIKIGSTDNLTDVRLPPMAAMANLEKDFKLPADMPPGKIIGNQKVFMQVLRAVSDKVQTVPPLQLVYFDTESGSYKTIQTAPIPLTVLPAANNTAKDVGGQQSETVKQEIETFAEGIAYNYEGLDVIESHDYDLKTLVKQPLWLVLLILPCLAFFALLILYNFGPLTAASTIQWEQKKTYAQVQKRLKNLKEGNRTSREICEELLEALKVYLGYKLKIPNAALTYKEVELALKTQAISSEQLEELKGLFKWCEAGRYAGYVTEGTELKKQIEGAHTLITDLERVLK